MKSIVVLPPKKMDNFLAFHALRMRHTRFGRTIGLELGDEVSVATRFGGLICCLHQVVLYVNLSLVTALMAVEHIRGRGDMLNDCIAFVLIIGEICNAIPGYVFYKKQTELKQLLEWCQQLRSEVGYDEAVPDRILRWLFYVPYIGTVLSALGPLIVNNMSEMQLLPVPLYPVLEVLNNPRLFAALFIYEVVVFNVFWRINAMLLTTYVMLVKSISGQYRALAQHFIDATKLPSEAIDELLDSIGRQHAELLHNLKVTGSIFNTPLLFNEFSGVICVTISMTILAYHFEQVIFAIVAFVCAAFSFLYPFLGQEISSSAEAFEQAAYACDWHEFSMQNRRKVALIMLMSQKQVGVNSGGFHFSNYLEISQVGEVVVDAATFKCYKNA